MTDIAARTAVCQAYLDGLVAGDLNAVLSLFADDATVEDPVGTEPKVGREALAAFYQIACDFVTAAQLTGTPRVAGNEVAFRFNEAGKIVSMRAWWGGDNVRPA
jgi:steroid delta-isomerase